MENYANELGFWKRLENFVSDVQTGCCAGEEEKEMILNVCKLKILDIQRVSSSAKQNDIKEMILAEYKKGNIVVSTFEGLQVAPLKEIIKQPTDGLLYDLNRNEAVVLTFINDPKWINDYAMVQVVRELKQQLEDKAQ